MSTIQFQSMQDIYDVQIEHLQAQYSHLKFMHEYHSWMRSEMAEPKLSDLHGAIVDTVDEALQHLDQLIETLQLSSLSEAMEARSINSTSD